jgi:hypothetical protein
VITKLLQLKKQRWRKIGLFPGKQVIAMGYPFTVCAFDSENTVDIVLIVN